MKPANRAGDRHRRTILDKDIALGIAGLIIFFGLLVTAGRADYLAFHSAIEFLVASVALALFAVSWHTRRLVDDDFLTVLGICFLFESGVVIMHALSYEGIRVFPGATPTTGSQFWLVARALLAVGLVVAPSFIGKRLRRPVLAMVLFGAPVLVAIVAVFTHRFPVTFVQGHGLTAFKVVSEWLIIGMMGLAWWLLWRKRDRLEPTVFRDMSIAIVCMIVAELFFTAYTSLTDTLNVVGHVFHLASFYFVYRALVARSLEDPFSVLFHQLRLRENELREENHYSEGLNRITAEINSWLSVDDVLSHSVAGAAEIAGADGAVVSLRRDDGRFGVRYVHGTRLEQAQGLVLDREDAPSMFEAADTREPVIVADTSAGGGGIATTQFGTGALLVIPLVIHGDVRGVMSLHWVQPNDSVSSPRLILFARKLGAALSLALANAQLYEGEHRVAETLQNAMAASVETASNVEIGSVYRSAPGIGSIGGDFYDVFDLPNGHVAFLLGDVSGKGIEAAATNALARSTVRALAYRKHDPGSVLSGANEALLRQLADSEFVTAVFGVLDPASSSIEIALAGHPEPIVCGRPDLAFRAEARNPPLAVVSGESFETWRFTVECGDALVLFSDGICEARRGNDMFGTQRVRELLDTCGHETCQQIADRLLAAVERFSDGPLRDDVAVLVLRPRAE